MCLRLHNFKECLNGSDTVREANVRKHEGQYAEEEQKDGGMLFGEDNIKKNEIKDRAILVAKYEDDAEWAKAKRKWKKENPESNIKDWKQAYITGRIHELPWAQYVEQEQRIKPDLTEVIEPEGYKQNAEQSDNSVWNKIRKQDK